MNFVFQHAFYCHVYHRSLHLFLLKAFKARMAKEKEYLNDTVIAGSFQNWR